MSHDRKYPRAEALAVAKALCDALIPHCRQLVVAGSLRRRKAEVGDVEILYIPKFAKGPPIELFGEPPMVNETEFAIGQLLVSGTLKKRPNKGGVFTWGPENKLAIHQPSGIPVDLFATDDKRWWNALVCRTGGKQNNLLITTTAQRKGWSFEAYGCGFRGLGINAGKHHETSSERDVFEFLGLQYKEPWERL